MTASDLYTQRLLLVQSYKESTWGTSGTATAKWLGLKGYPEFTPYRKSTIFEEVRGNLAPGFQAAILRNGGEFKMGGYCTYEDMIFLYHSLLGIVVPTGSYTYTYTGAITAQPTIQSYTIEYSQPGSFALATGCVINKLGIKGESEKNWEWDASGFCQDINAASTGSPASLADRTLEATLFPGTSLYMDTTSSPYGSTTMGTVLTDFSVDIESGVTPIYTAGSLAPSHWVMNKPKLEVTLSLLYNSTVRAMLNTTLMGGSIVRTRLNASSSSKVNRIDFAGVLTDDPKLFGEKDGAQLVQIKLGGIYDGTEWLQTVVTNGVSALP